MQILKEYFDGKSHFKYDNNPKELLAKEGLDYTVLPDADLSSGETNPQGRKLTNLIHWSNTKSRDIVLKNWDNEIFKDASVPLETFLDNLKENFYEFK